jgi:hypothetical protein
VPSSMPPL